MTDTDSDTERNSSSNMDDFHWIVTIIISPQTPFSLRFPETPGFPLCDAIFIMIPSFCFRFPFPAQSYTPITPHETDRPKTRPNEKGGFHLLKRRNAEQRQQQVPIRQEMREYAESLSPPIYVSLKAQLNRRCRHCSLSVATARFQ